MRALALHPPRWNGPDALLVVELVERRANHFPCPSRGQDRELERPGRDALLLAQLGNERANFLVRQRGVVPYRSCARSLRQQVLEMAAPPCRVLSS